MLGISASYTNCSIRDEAKLSMAVNVCQGLIEMWIDSPRNACEALEKIENDCLDKILPRLAKTNTFK